MGWVEYVIRIGEASRPIILPSAAMIMKRDEL
jgi:hypothetical protein